MINILKIHTNSLKSLGTTLFLGRNDETVDMNFLDPYLVTVQVVVFPLNISLTYFTFITHSELFCDQ